MNDLGLKRGTVRLEEYTSVWIDEYEKEKRILMGAFSDRILAIEHIGSTAIPGMPSKPIIDILIAVTSLDDIGDFIRALPSLGYEYIPERRFSDRQFFPKGPEFARTHHVSLVEQGSETGWKNHLLFRDFMRTHEKEREEYARLKRDLAQQFADDRGSYTEAKSAFVLSIIEKARSNLTTRN